MNDFEVHTDGSAIWIDCPDCGTVTEWWSLPVSLRDMNMEARDHSCE